MVVKDYVVDKMVEEMLDAAFATGWVFGCVTTSIVAVSAYFWLGA